MDQQIFQVYGGPLTNSRFDRESIMLYPIDRRLTIGQSYEVRENTGLSQADRDFIGRAYQFGGKAESGPAALDIGDPPIRGEIAVAGTPATFALKVPRPGRYAIATGGDLDTFLTLRDAGSTQLAEDDDSGPGLNAKIEMDLAAGDYTVQVRNVLRAETGEFTISAAKATRSSP